MLTAQDLMSADPVTVRARDKVRKAVNLLQALEIRHLPVVDDDGMLIGILSDRDLKGLEIPHLIGDEFAGNLQTALEASVASVMSTDVLSVEPEADAAEIVDLMLDNKIGAVPVTDDEGALVGIVSYVDVLRALPLSDG